MWWHHIRAFETLFLILPGYVITKRIRDAAHVPVYSDLFRAGLDNEQAGSGVQCSQLFASLTQSS